VYISRIQGEKHPERIEPKFCFVIVVRNVIMCFKFGDDRLRDLESAEGQNAAFPVDFRPYNTLTQRCKRVIYPRFLRLTDGFPGRVIKRCQINSTATDLVYHGNDILVKIGYNLACTRYIISEILASSRGFSGRGY